MVAVSLHPLNPGISERTQNFHNILSSMSAQKVDIGEAPKVDQSGQKAHEEVLPQKRPRGFDISRFLCFMETWSPVILIEIPSRTPRHILTF
jgi:hypothetical protein